MSSKKIWSLPLVLVTALLLVGLFAASVLAQANRASVPATMSVVAPSGSTAAVVIYQVSNYTAPADSATTGASGILAVNVTTTAQTDADGAAVAEASRGAFTGAFAVKADAGTPTDATRFDRVTVTPSDPTVAGNTYTLRVVAAYDTDITADAPDQEPGIADDDITWTADGDNANDQDGELVTILTVHIPMVEPTLQFQVEPAKVVKGELISRVGRDRDSNPLSFDVKNAGPGTVTVERAAGVTAVDFEVSAGNKVLVRADENNVAATAYGGTISIARGDHDLDGVDTNNSIDITISANVNTATPLVITEADGTTEITTTDDDPYHYEITIPETTAPGTGVLAYYVGGAAAAINGSGDADNPEVPAEKITGVIGGASANLFRVDNENMAIEYAGPANGLAAGVDHELRLTASGDRGLANRVILGMVKITVADVDSAPIGVPSELAIDLDENVKTGDTFQADGTTSNSDGLVSDNTVVHDFAGVGSDPEGRTLTYSTTASDFDFDGTKLMTNGAIGDIERDDNPATADVEEDDWPIGAPGDWSFADSPVTGLYPDLERDITVIASDGVPSNDKSISVTITLSLNEPTQRIESDLPTSPYEVTFGMVDRDTDDDATTDDVATPTYSVTVRAAQRDLPLTVLQASDLISDADAGDTLVYTEVDGPRHLTINRDGSVDLLVMPVGANTETGDTGTLEVSITDGFNDGDPAVPDQHFYIAITVIEEIRPIESEFVGITVVENGTACELTDGGGACTLAGHFDNAATYTIESGVQTGDTDYSIDRTSGIISVDTAPNFEDGNSPAFIVNVSDANRDLLGFVSVRVTITDEPEAPVLAAIDGVPWVYETAQIGDDVVEKPAAADGPSDSDLPISISATDQDAGASITYTISSTGTVPFSVDSSSGALTVSGALDRETDATHAFTVRATDEDNLYDEMDVTVHVLNANEAPIFTSPTGDAAVTTIPENTPNSVIIFTFTATDEDVDDLEFNLREGQSRDLFVIEGAGSNMVNGVEVWSGELHVKTGVTLDYEDAGYDPRVHVEANDPEGLNATLLLTVNLSNVNDNEPAFDSPPATQLSVAENTVRGTTLANYSATDADGDTVTYSLGGGDAGSFSIDGYGNLMTLESLDADRQVPCGSDGCAVMVIASDGTLTATADVRITVTAVEDSVSTLDVSKANPVPGTEMGNPMSALSNAKDGGYEYLWNQLDCAGMLDLVGASDNAVNRAAYCHMWDGMTDANQKKVRDTYIAMGVSAPAESPYDLPATYGSSPLNFVETAWANWGTVLRIEVTAEAPDASCGNGNQCVVINVNSDSADDSIKLEAYRVDTPAGSASKENHYVAALMLVELSSDATPGTDAVFAGVGGGVAALKVDEEDEVEVEFGNLRDTIDVENEAPEVSNFAPEHERAFDDPDVDYTFTVTDDNSGLPEPEDLPDNDGDENYTPVVALISKSEGGVGQCSVAKTAPKDTDVVLNFAAHIHEDDTLYCPGTEQEGEYVASEGGFGFAPIRDDKDFDEIDNGYDVETTIVLTENDTYYVTFIVCDNAGNCAYHDPDGNDDNEELAEITVDTLDPVFVEARTGLNWDSTDNEYDDDRNYIQVIFNDLTTLNPATVEVDDFVVEGHTIESVTVYENPDDDDVNWGDSGRYAEEGSRNLRHIDRYRDLENAVFLELADELLADETPDVTIVPNGVEDGAGNEQDDGDQEADDWISPKFTVVSITSTLETAQDEVLAGDGDEITLVVTADERLDATRPTVTVTYVNAPAGSVDTKGVATCDTSAGANEGTRDRGEIVNTDDCQDSSAAKGGTLNNSVEKVSNTEWIVTVTEPKDTGYYSFRISGVDRSPQENPGSEGIAADSIVTDFFDSDGDVNTDDAVFWEGDINLANPNVRVSGNVITDNEPDIEYRSPLFVEIDFTANHWSYVDCRGEDDNDNLAANCINENSEYAEDNFDDIVITMFELDGVDMTDSVKTTDDQTFLVTLENVALGDHTARIQAMDVAGNTLEDVLEIDFEVSDRDPFERRLNPGWNLVSLPGEPADSSIGSVFGPGVEVRTVYTYDPVVPGGWMVAVRETLDSDWQGDLTEITGTRGYWVLSDAIQDWEVSIPRLAGGAAGTGTPIQPPVIALYAGWNLIPVTDISGNAGGGDTVSAEVYLQNLDDGLDLARVLGFDTIRNQWETVLDPDMQMNNTLTVGSAYWIFVREAASLVPSGYVSGGGSD